MINNFRPVFAIAILAFLTSCSDENVGTQESFFPLENNSTWAYQHWMIMHDENATRSIIDTLELHVAGDTIVEGISYKMISRKDGTIDKLVRREGRRYFGRHHELYGTFTKEYLFLDTSVPIGGSWSHVKTDAYITRTEYIITGKNTHRDIGGKKYTDVIEVKVNYYYTELEQEVLWLTAIHYYSKDGGEIYNYYPYPVSNLYADSESILLSPGK
jgi:hypothetical protein